MQDYSRPMEGFVALKFGILIAKRLSNEKSMSSNLALIPVAKKIGQKVHFKTFFGEIQQMINKSGNKSLFQIIFG